MTARKILWFATFMVLARIAIFAVDGRKGLESDTRWLAQHNRAWRACMVERGISVLKPCPQAGHFPPMQHLIAFPLGALGMSDAHIVRTLAILSFAAFLALLWLGWRTLSSRGPPRLRAFWITLLGTSPLLYYAQSSFGEMLAALLTAAAVVACLELAPLWAIGLLFFLAGLTKEVAAPFLVLLSAVALFHDGKLHKQRLPAMIVAGAGAGLSVFCNMIFNLFRFGVAYNVINLAADIPKVPFLDWLSHVVGMWVAPNVGLVVFWPLFVALLGGLGRAVTSRLPFWVVLGVLGALTAGFASWWAPFGWVAWGPRLLLPWLPACALLLLAVYSKEMVFLLDGLSMNRMLARALVVLVVVAGMIQFASLFGFGAMEAVFSPAPGCPVAPVRERVTDEYYFHCLRYFTWEPRLSIPRLLGSVLRPPATAFAAAYAVAIAGWSLKSLRGVRSRT